MVIRKAILEQNTALKSKQRFLVDGLVSADIVLLSRDPLEMSIGVIELPDQTRVPGGVRRAGEFGLTLQFGRNSDREVFRRWHMMCVDQGERGIDPTYKRSGTIVYYRVFQGSPGTFNSGSDLPPIRARLFGLWPQTINLPDMDLTADEGEDGSCVMEVTMSFDDADLVPQETAAGGLGGI